MAKWWKRAVSDTKSIIKSTNDLVTGDSEKRKTALGDITKKSLRLTNMPLEVTTVETANFLNRTKLGKQTGDILEGIQNTITGKKAREEQAQARMDAAAERERLTSEGEKLKEESRLTAIRQFRQKELGSSGFGSSILGSFSKNKSILG